MTDKTLAQQVEGWLETAGISQLSEWDVLLFLFRHGTSIVSASQISHLLGYSKSEVGKTLDSLVVRGRIFRSRSYQGVRAYEMAKPVDALVQESCQQLMALSMSREGRLLIVGCLRKRAPRMNAHERAGLHLAQFHLAKKEARRG